MIKHLNTGKGKCLNTVKHRDTCIDLNTGKHRNMIKHLNTSKGKHLNTGKHRDTCKQVNTEIQV